MAQLENIEAIEKRLWTSADSLRANSNYASNEYFLPVMGFVFLRHALSRYLAVKPDIEASLPSRGGQTRPLTKEDFSMKSAIFLRREAQFDYLVNLTDSDDRAQAIINAMEAIEEDYETLKGVLPKSEYQDLIMTCSAICCAPSTIPLLNPLKVMFSDASTNIFSRSSLTRRHMTAVNSSLPFRSYS